jgi:hypothetical protein
MTRRRARRSATRLLLIWWAALIAAGLALSVAHVIGWILATAVISGAAYAQGRKSATQPARGKLSLNAAYGKPGAFRGGSLPRVSDVTEMDAVSAYPASMRRERANGWTAPAKSSMLLSAECAAETCVWCHDARCEHGCGHPSRGTERDKPPF